MIIQRQKDIENLQRLLDQFPIVVLYGPRRIGKTTLAKQLNPDQYLYADILSFSRDTFLNKINKLTGLVVIDEIHYAIDILPRLKQIVDQRKNIKFLLLSSSSILALPHLRSQLTGRCAFYELSGLKLSDVDYDIRSNFLKGGYPEAYCVNLEASYKFREDYILASIPLGLRDSGLKLSIHLTKTLLKLISQYNGLILSKSVLAEKLSISTSTVETYLSFLENFSIIRRVPHADNNKKPKLIFRDSGILNNLLQIKDQDTLLKVSNIDQIWQSYVIEASINDYSLENVSYYIDNKGNEIDLIFIYKGLKFGLLTSWSGRNKVTTQIRDIILKYKIDKLLIINNVGKNADIEHNIFFSTLDNLLNYLENKTTKNKKISKMISTNKSSIGPLVFISYSHKDSIFVKKLKNKLQKKNIGIHIDTKELKFGDIIKDFISHAIRKTDFTVQIISINSLRSPYVMIEYLETQIYEIADGKKRYIPIFIDRTIFQNDTYLALADDIQKEIREVNVFITEALTRNLTASLYNVKRDRLLDLKNNLGKAMEKLRDSLIGDFTNDKLINENIDKLIEILKT